MKSLIGQSLGRYHILEQLGEGGMATVYKAFDTRLEREVAIKIIRREAFPPDQLDRILIRFEREAKSLAKLSHPNIVGVIDYGDHKGSPYLVMEFLPSGTLKQRLGKSIQWKEAVRLLLPIARALQFAHEQRIIHRDVKPSNILITLSGEPMLSDFGIAKILESGETATLTGTGIGIGTPEYMAPEQWTGKTYPQSDIYSLGVVFYEMVTGQKPYVADTPAAILLKQANEPLPRPSRMVSGLPIAIEKVLLKALAKKPEDRYQSMAAFRAALENLLTDADRKSLTPRGINADRPALMTKGQKSRFSQQPILWRRLLPIGMIITILIISIPIGFGLFTQSTHANDEPGHPVIEISTSTQMTAQTFTHSVTETRTAMTTPKRTQTTIPAVTITRISELSSPNTIIIYGDNSDAEVLNRFCPDPWNACRDATQGNAVWDNLTVLTIGATHDSKGFTIQRGIFFFNTRSIPADAIISKVIANFYVSTFINGNTTIHIVRSYATAPLGISDFNKIDFSSGGAAKPLTPNSWITIQLNANALNWIFPASITTLALIHEYDLLDTVPQVPNDVLIATAEDTNHQPYLSITYSLPK